MTKPRLALFALLLLVAASAELAIVGITARLAQKPDCSTMAASAPLNSASFFSSSGRCAFHSLAASS